MKNPFIYNSPVYGKDFFNREKLIKKISEEVLIGKTQGDVWITGERKTGKTSLLKFIYHDYSKKAPKSVDIYGSENKLTPIFVFANVQYCRNEHEFFNELWQSVKNELDIKLYIPDNEEKNLVESLKKIYNKGFYTVFLIDEFDAFLETLIMENVITFRNFINKFNSISTNFPSLNRKIFSCIYTSNQDFLDLKQKYDIKLIGSGMIAQTYDLDWFYKKHFKELINRYLTKSSKATFTLKELDILYKYTKGYPYFLQRILHFMFDYKIENGNARIDETVIKKFAAKEFERTIKFWAGQNIPNRTQTKLNEHFKTLGYKMFDASLKFLVEYAKNQL